MKMDTMSSIMTNIAVVQQQEREAKEQLKKQKALFSLEKKKSVAMDAINKLSKSISNVAMRTSSDIDKAVLHDIKVYLDTQLSQYISSIQL